MRLSELELREAFPPADLKAWRALVETDLAGAPFDKKLVSHTYEGIRVQPLYTAADWDGSGDPSGFSGAMPMTRGARVLGQRALGWDLCQERAEPDLAMANRAILEDLEGGVNTVLLQLDARFEPA